MTGGGSALGQRFAPMLATTGSLPRDDAAWAYEIKWDGVRAITYVEGGSMRVESRNLIDITPRYPELGGLPEALGGRVALKAREGIGQQMTGQRIEPLPIVEVGNAPLDPDRVWIHRNDALDSILGLGLESTQPLRVVDLKGEREVFGRQGLAIMPGKAGPQLPGDFHAAVRLHAPGIRVELGKRLGEIRSSCSLAINQCECCVEQSRGALGVGRTDDLNSQVADLGVDHHA